jgi:hypothetical protein
MTKFDASYLTRSEAAKRIRDLFGIPCTASTLATKACDGSGPVYRLGGGKALYSVADVDEWASEQLGPPIRRASEARRMAGEAA